MARQLNCLDKTCLKKTKDKGVESARHYCYSQEFRGWEKGKNVEQELVREVEDSSSSHCRDVEERDILIQVNESWKVEGK